MRSSNDNKDSSEATMVESGCASILTVVISATLEANQDTNVEIPTLATADSWTRRATVSTRLVCYRCARAAISESLHGKAMRLSAWMVHAKAAESWVTSLET